jgi:peptidoglycan/xylan/chitin deacetylase (PgdA/CDA1 family)
MSGVETLKAPLTVVMYHYVRPIRSGPTPRLKGLEVEAFRGQLAYLRRHYQPVGIADVVAAGRGETALPPNAVLLTFDDGYRDHVETVCPLLLDAGMTAAFYPIVDAVLHNELLGVNKLHFVLALAPDTTRVVEALERLIVADPEATRLPSLEELRACHRHATRLDDADVIYVKRLIQMALPVPMRKRISDVLFREFVTTDESGFAGELYASAAELRALAAAGMHIGCHGASHHWMSRLDRKAQAEEVEKSLRLLDHLGLKRADFTFCYPYGDYDQTSIEVLEAAGCAAAFTAEVAIADVAPANMLRLPRLDTIDLPVEADAMPNRWTRDITSACLQIASGA